jgi:selenocysteine lyase/cysteine desulfurase
MKQSVDRRGFLAAAGLSVTGGALAAAFPAPSPAPKLAGDAPGDWSWVRDQFAVARDRAHFASFFITSHPRPVREAIEALRRQIDDNPFDVVEHGLFSKPDEVRAAAARYLGAAADEVALTRSTTEGLALVYAGLALRAGQEVLTTAHDHYSQHESIRLAAARAGATARRIALYDDPARASEDEIADRLRRGLGPKTRAVGVTWVHSSTGVKLPIRRLGDVVAEANRGRAARDRILLVVDGVHGIGVEDETIAQMGCDVFAAGTHKWLFGPRGTGIVWARKDAWAQLEPTVPSFEEGPYNAWMAGAAPGPTRAAWMSPGGFHAYEHMWALPAAFEFHERIGRARIAARIHELNARIKDGLDGVRGVKVLTPRDERLSSGLVAFAVAGRTPADVVKGLAARRIVASTSPYSPSFARLAGSLLNVPEEVDAAVAAVAEIAAAG